MGDRNPRVIAVLSGLLPSYRYHRCAFILCVMKREPLNKKHLLRQQDHLTRPPRLEGKVKNAMMNPAKKPPKKGRKP